MARHSWSSDEYATVCNLFIDNYILEKNSMILDSLVSLVINQFPHLKKKSIEMSFGNFAQLAKEVGYKANISCLPNYSKKQKEVFLTQIEKRKKELMCKR